MTQASGLATNEERIPFQRAADLFDSGKGRNLHFRTIAQHFLQRHGDAIFRIAQLADPSTWGEPTWGLFGHGDVDTCAHERNAASAFLQRELSGGGCNGVLPCVLRMWAGERDVAKLCALAADEGSAMVVRTIAALLPPAPSLPEPEPEPEP